MSTPASGAARRRRPRSRSRHVADAAQTGFTPALKALEELAYEGVQVSVRIEDVDSGQALLAIDDYVVMPLGSLGAVLLLIDVAARMEIGDLDPLTVLDREEEDAVSASGPWEHLQIPSLPLIDLAELVAATSDGVATNTLLRAVGLDAVRARAEGLGILRTAVLDRVRNERGPDDAPHVSVGSVRELAGLFRGLARREVVDEVTSAQVMDWMTGHADLSLVSAAFGLDPLAHRAPDHGLSLAHRTGAARGVRAEAGVLRGPSGAVSYAIAVSYPDRELRSRLIVLDALRRVGLNIVEYVA